MRERNGHALCGGVAATLCLLGIPLAAIAKHDNKAPAAVAAPKPVPAVPEDAVEETIDTITLRGATTRSAIGLILRANNVPYVIDDAFPKDVRTSLSRSEDRIVIRHKPKEDTFPVLLQTVARLSSIGLSYRLDPGVNGGTLYLAPRRDNEEPSPLTPLPLPVSRLLPKYVNERQVPRRVRGLLFRDVY